RHWEVERSLHFLDGGQLALSALLSIECEYDTDRLGTGGSDDVDRLPNRRSGGDHIVDDEHAPAQLRPDDRASFAVILRVFAVECPRNAASMGIGERDRGGGDERDAFVRRTEQHIELDARLLNCIGIVATELRERASGVEQACVEEVGAETPGLELELAEAEHAKIEAEVDEGGGSHLRKGLESRLAR